jgi:ribosome-associated protein
MKDREPESTAAGAEVPSKSQLKREAKALFKLGRALAELPPSELDSLSMDNSLREAIVEARATRSNVARKRQLGYVAKLLRQADTEPLLEAMEVRRHSGRVDAARLHRAENWRDALIEQGDSLLAELLRARPDVDAQALRQLIRNARREIKHDKPPATARKLFRLLRQLDEATPLPALPA